MTGISSYLHAFTRIYTLTHAEMMREEIYLALDDMAKEKGIISHEGVLGISAGVTGEGLPHLSKSIRELVELGEQFRSDQNELYVVES